MKKFMAAFLSAIVGVFGYTLTDVAVEDRIANLESEVAELRGNSSGSTDKLEIGDYLKLNASSNTRFLFREDENGKLEYISPDKVDEIKEDDIFIDVTDIEVQVKDFETVTYSIGCGVNYKPDSFSVKVPVLSLSFNGSAPESLAGKQITLEASFFLNNSSGLPFLNKDVICMISSDGSFGFNGDLIFDIKSLYTDAIAEYLYFMSGRDATETELEELFCSSKFFGFSSLEIS